MTDICKKGARASAEVQKAKARARWELLDLHCLQCGKKFEWSETLSGCTQRRKKFCDARCVANFRWDKYSEATGKPRPTKEDDVFIEEAFQQKCKKSRQYLYIHSRKVYFCRFSAALACCELCGCSRICPEVAHVKAVKTFPDGTPFFVVNQLQNLIGLCPTCHRMYDAGMIHRVWIEEAIARRKPRPAFQLTPEEQARWDQWAAGLTKSKREPRYKRKTTTL